MGTPLGPKYVPYTYMDPLGLYCCNNFLVMMQRANEPEPTPSRQNSAKRVYLGPGQNKQSGPCTESKFL